MTHYAELHASCHSLAAMLGMHIAPSVYGWHIWNGQVNIATYEQLTEVHCFLYGWKCALDSVQKRV